MPRLARRGFNLGDRGGTSVLVLAGALVALSAGLLAPGRTWGQIGRTSSAVTTISHIHGMAVDPFDSRVLWVATHAGLYRFVNRATWTKVGSSQADMMGFVVHPTGRRVLLTSGHPGPAERAPNPTGVAISRDGGGYWEQLSLAGKADFHAMAVSPADPQTMYAWNVWGSAGVDQGLHRSRNGGLTWGPLGRGGFTEVFGLRAHPREPETVFAATDRGLRASRDGGRTWAALHPSLADISVTALDVHVRRPGTIYAYTAAGHLGLGRSTDGGRTWNFLGFHLGDRDTITGLASDPADPSVLYLATATGSLFWSWDGGQTRRRLVNQGRIESR